MKHLLPYALFESDQTLQKSTFNYDDYRLSWWGSYEKDIFLRYDEIKNAPVLDAYEAALLVAADDKLFADIADYKYQNTPLPEDSSDRLMSILSRVTPVDNTFYRGVERRDYDDDHIMKVQSWSVNKNTAEIFGRYIYQTTAPCVGVELGSIYYWNGLINDSNDGFGDVQAEWFLLNPEKELL